MTLTQTERKKTKMKIKTFIVREGAKLPFKATAGSAGADLYACIDTPVTFAPGEQVMIPVGIAMEIPEGCGGFIFPRSSMAVKGGISMPNCVGVIDSDYRGEISVPLVNLGKWNYTVNPYDRIAQIVIMPVENAEYEEVEVLSSTERGEGGFGSTGKN